MKYESFSAGLTLSTILHWPWCISCAPKDVDTRFQASTPSRMLIVRRPSESPTVLIRPAMLKVDMEVPWEEENQARNRPCQWRYSLFSKQLVEKSCRYGFPGGCGHWPVVQGYFSRGKEKKIFMLEMQLDTLSGELSTIRDPSNSPYCLSMCTVS